MCLKLSLVNEIVAEIPLLQMQLPNETDGLTSSPSVENFIGQQSSIMACLALIGGYDLRPRLGGTMVHLDTGALGVVRKITAMSGKLQLQMLDGKCATAHYSLTFKKGKKKDNKNHRNSYLLRFLFCYF